MSPARKIVDRVVCQAPDSFPYQEQPAAAVNPMPPVVASLLLVENLDTVRDQLIDDAAVSSGIATSSASALTRLRMLDLLTLGDLSRTDSEDLDLPSNLVAHHFKVLENEGTIRRDRSEGDGPRT